MPNTPVTWRDQFTVNTTTANNQSDPAIIQLANGNIVVSWTTDDPGGLGAATGVETFGQIFDPLGNKIGAEIRLNNASSLDNEQNADLAALPGGGFAVVYHDLDFGGGPGSNIRLDLFDANGNWLPFATTLVVGDSGSNGDPNYRNPVVAVSSATSVLIAYESTSGGTVIAGKIYNPTTDTYSAEFGVSTVSEAGTDPDVAVLTNGNYVITLSDANLGNPRIIYRIIDAAGNNVLSETEVIGTGDANFDGEASVTALPGGGFVIAYTHTEGGQTDVLLSVYDAAGIEISNTFVGSISPTNNNNEAAVTALADGSFVVVYDNDELVRLDVDHFTAGGAYLGTFNFAGSGTTPVVTALADGRFAVAWQNSVGEISMEMLDTRDAVNNPGVYTPDPWQVGTVNSDTFTLADATSNAGGGNGVDTITGNFLDNLINGGLGNDVLDGAAGNDTADYADKTTAVVVTLNGATAVSVSVGGVAEDSIRNFENVNGGSGNDTLTGDGLANKLGGAAGNDTLNGGIGADTLIGGFGNDTYNVDNAGDTVQEAAGQGTDTVYASVAYTLTAGQEIETLIGNAGATGLTLRGNDLVNSIFGNSGNDVLFGNGGNDTLTGNGGNDILNGGTGADRLIGGLGNDTYNVDNSSDTVTEAAGQGTDTVYASVNYALGAGQEVEKLIANAGATGLTLSGNDLVNQVFGNAGNDVIFGNAGNDILYGQGGNDTLNGGTGTDVMIGGIGNDTYNVESSTDSAIEATGQGSDTVYSSTSYTLSANQEIERLIGNAGATGLTLVGNNLVNQVIGIAATTR